VCGQEISKTRRLKPTTGLWKIQPQWVVTPGKEPNNKQIYMNFKNVLITENLEIGKNPFRNALEFLSLNILGAALRKLNVEP
jgi:hypothetical protein